jgi:hypothetical protein
LFISSGQEVVMKSKSKAKSTNRKMSQGAAIPMHSPIGGCGDDIMEQTPEVSFEDCQEPPIGTTESSAFAPDQVDTPEANVAPVTAPIHPVVTKPEFCLMVAPDGEWPFLEIYPDLGSLTNRLRGLEGADMSAFPFFGIPVPFTRGPNRFLQLPDGRPYPVHDFADFGTFVPNPTATLPIDTSYFIGPEDERRMAPDPAVIDHRPAIAHDNAREA